VLGVGVYVCAQEGSVGGDAEIACTGREKEPPGFLEPEGGGGGGEEKKLD